MRPPRGRDAPRAILHLSGGIQEKRRILRNRETHTKQEPPYGGSYLEKGGFEGYAFSSAVTSSIGMSTPYQIFSPTAACSFIMPMPVTTWQPLASAFWSSWVISG